MASCMRTHTHACAHTRMYKHTHIRTHACTHLWDARESEDGLRIGLLAGPTDRVEKRTGADHVEQAANTGHVACAHMSMYQCAADTGHVACAHRSMYQCVLKLHVEQAADTGHVACAHMSMYQCVLKLHVEKAAVPGLRPVCGDESGGRWH
eukprot:1161921-Pelagomonas_calceolata.AAC.12